MAEKDQTAVAFLGRCQLRQTLEGLSPSGGHTELVTSFLAVLAEASKEVG